MTEVLPRIGLDDGAVHGPYQSVEPLEAAYLVDLLLDRGRGAEVLDALLEVLDGVGVANVVPGVLLDCVRGRPQREVLPRLLGHRRPEEGLVDGLHDVRLRDRLHEVIVEVEVREVRVGFDGGQHYDPAADTPVTDAFEDPVAGHVRHPTVEQHHVGLPDAFERVGAGVRRLHGVVVPQPERIRVRDVLVVVHDQHGRLFHRRIDGLTQCRSGHVSLQ